LERVGGLRVDRVRVRIRAGWQVHLGAGDVQEAARLRARDLARFRGADDVVRRRDDSGRVLGGGPERAERRGERCVVRAHTAALASRAAGSAQRSYSSAAVTRAASTSPTRTPRAGLKYT